MSLSSTRPGGNAPGLPGPVPLPPLTAALSRRAALFGAAPLALGVAASPVLAQGAPSGDADLIARCAAFAALREREQRAYAALPDDWDDDAPGYVEACRLTDDVFTASETLAAMSATTAQGVSAKASAILALVSDRVSNPEEMEATFQEHHGLVLSLVWEAARLGNGGAA